MNFKKTIKENLGASQRILPLIVFILILIFLTFFAVNKENNKVYGNIEDNAITCAITPNKDVNTCFVGEKNNLKEKNIIIVKPTKKLIQMAQYFESLKLTKNENYDNAMKQFSKGEEAELTKDTVEELFKELSFENL